MPVTVVGTVAMEAQLSVGLVEVANDLKVNVRGFNYDFGGTLGTYEGAVYQSVADDDTNYVYLDAGELLVINTTGWPGAGIYIPLAKVITNGGVIQRVADERILITVAPEGSGDKKVKVSSNDTTPDFLESKLVAGSGITLTTQDEGVDESVQIAGRNIKSGVLIPGAFSGDPKKATVTFTTAYPDTNYTIGIDAVTQNGITYPIRPENKATTGFDVVLGSNNIAHLIEVGWQTVATGE